MVPRHSHRSPGDEELADDSLEGDELAVRDELDRVLCTTSGLSEMSAPLSSRGMSSRGTSHTRNWLKVIFSSPRLLT